LIWIQYAISRKEIRKTEKRKRRKKEKYEKGPGGTVSAQARIQPIAQLT
jgi:hypothetical protein